ncbi:formylglycine-generating enzyme family protein [Rhizobium laguerreae]|uniref:formylglycine-generating enzyme family protein n=1 Tax=Rhizobium laguerreae TaxID=1076926 RepID=UPI001C92699D|nr:formylglycine-generating enzyme family protein [Rhizobium laguerreae]MBY3151378.1 formylglycine-generating enzyme family protein [Rhizobium laguerreae]
MTTKATVMEVGDRFRDFADAPEMTIVPTGNFVMGSGQGQGGPREHPQRVVTISYPCAIGIAPVTRHQFGAFVKATGHEVGSGATALVGMTWTFDATKSWLDPGFPQTDDHPVVCVNWNDAKAYAAWLREMTGRQYGLPSEAQWEYCCRAGTATEFNTGDVITANDGNFSANVGGTTSVFAFPPNLWGLHDTHGNVWEWCEDGWHADYSGNPPTDGSVWVAGDSAKRVVRGGSWTGYPHYARAAYRDSNPLVARDKDIGFRVIAYV